MTVGHEIQRMCSSAGGEAGQYTGVETLGYIEILRKTGHSKNNQNLIFQL